MRIGTLLLAGALAMARVAAQETQTLRALVAPYGLRIGVCVDAHALVTEPGYGELLARECSVVTPENALKFAPLRPTRDRFAFENADAIVAFALDHDMRVRGHTLVWHNQIPAWLTEGEFTPEELADLLHDHIRTVMGRYRGKVFAWDVVNEAIEEDGTLRDSFWRQHLGPEYVAQAFRWAREADPHALLCYNDYVAEGGGKKSKAIYEFVKSLKKQGVPIDAVGLQMHLTLEDPPKPRYVKRAIRRFAALGLKVHITELDVRMKMPATADALERQAQVYASLLDIARDRTACTDFVLWGLDDGHSWVPLFFKGWGDALIFDAAYRPKPAYDAMIKTLSACPRFCQFLRRTPARPQ